MDTRNSVPVRMSKSLKARIDSVRGNKSIADFLDLFFSEIEGPIEDPKDRKLNEISKRLINLESVIMKLTVGELEEIKTKPVESDQGYEPVNNYASFMGYVYSNLNDERMNQLKKAVVGSERYSGEVLDLINKVLDCDMNLASREQYILGLAGAYYERKFGQIDWDHFWSVSHPGFQNIQLMFDEIPSAITSVEILESQGSVDYADAIDHVFEYCELQVADQVKEETKKPASEVRQRV